jgi:hypothetical protein
MREKKGEGLRPAATSTAILTARAYRLPLDLLALSHGGESWRVKQSECG